MVSRFLGKLEARRHLISGRLSARAGFGKLAARAAPVARPAAAPLMNFRRSMSHLPRWISNRAAIGDPPKVEQVSGEVSAFASPAGARASACLGRRIHQVPSVGSEGF